MRPTLVLALVLLVGSSARGTEFWVRPGGDDAATGTSTASAWATLVHAADVVDPGDTVHVHDGSYQGFYLRRSGTAGQPDHLRRRRARGADHRRQRRTPDGINVEGAAYVVHRRLRRQRPHARRHPRRGRRQFVTVRNCHAGLQRPLGHLQRLRRRPHDREQRGAPLASSSTASTSRNSGDRPIIRDNLVHDNHANGIHMNGDVSQGGDGIISNALVERNVIYGNGVGGGSGINMDGVTDSVVRNNLLYDNHASGISLYQIDGATGSTNNLVVNNTIVNAADGRWCVNINTGLDRQPRAQQHPLQLPPVPRRDHHRRVEPRRASSATTTA